MSSRVTQRRPTRRERQATEGAPPPKKLTQEEQDEADEKALEEACEKWCGRIIRIVTLGSMLWGLLSSVSEWAFRPPVLIVPVKLDGLPPFVLTGGTDGLGAAAARRLALDGARVILGARNLSKAEAFAASLRAETGNARVEARFLDLERLSSVVAFADSLASDEDSGGLSALLNNAASVEHACEQTEDGFETATQVNYLAPALLTTLLLPQLEASGGGRVVHVSCPAVGTAKYNVSDLAPLELELPTLTAPGCVAFGRYASAKLMALAYSSQLAKRTRAAGRVRVTTNAFDPISINTPSATAYAEAAAGSRRRGFGFGPQVIIRKVLGFVLSPILGPLWRSLSSLAMRTASDGGHGLVHVAASTELARVSGKLFSLGGGRALTKRAGCTSERADECGVAPLPPNTPDGADATRLWDATYAALAPWLPAGGGTHCEWPGVRCAGEAAVGGGSGAVGGGGGGATAHGSAAATRRTHVGGGGALAAEQSTEAAFEEDIDFD